MKAKLVTQPSGKVIGNRLTEEGNANVNTDNDAEKVAPKLVGIAFNTAVTIREAISSERNLLKK